MSRRAFTLVDGSSSKFWAITLDGPAHTVEFGRIGTAGQSSRKEFASGAEAIASRDKLVAEKVRKGYVEETTPGAGPAVPVAPKAKAGAKPAPEAPAVALAPMPAPTAELPEMPGPTIDLGPADRYWATWEPTAPVDRPGPGPFDREEAVAKFGRFAAGATPYEWKWAHARPGPNPSVEESRFWLAMIDKHRHSESPRSVLARISSLRSGPDEPPGFLDTAKKWEEVGHAAPIELAISIFQVYPFDQILDYWDAPLGAHDYVKSRSNQRLLDGFRQFVRPFLGPDQLRTMREKVRAHLPKAFLPPDMYTGFPPAWYLAAALGLSDEVAGLIRAIPDGHYVGRDNFADRYQFPQWLVLGLGDPGRVEAEWRRLRLAHHSPEEVGAWLATTRFAGLDVVRESILARPKREDAEALTAALAKARGPEVAPAMLELLAASKGPKPAGTWLEDNPAFAIAGLIEVAGGKGKLAGEAIAFLGEQKKKGRAEFLAICLESAPAEAAAKVRREVLDREEVAVAPLDEASTPGAIAAAVRASAKLGPPGWVAPRSLPDLLVGGRAMTEAQISSLLAGLAKSTLAARSPIVEAVREHADRASLDSFAWALFELWRKEGMPAKEKWAMTAIGLLGSDGSALKLTPLIRAWPGESQHARAVTGLECLRAIGTDGAMMQLNGIAQKLPFKGLKAKAAEMMEAIAADRKMTRAELEDRIVPDCDLDERGSRTFDFGPRQFTLVLGGEMKPMVRDAEGKLKPDLPRPGAKDDPALAAAAVESWKLLKKQIREVARVQADRLERAMIVGRRWTVGDFRTLLVGHPLMTNLARLVVWGGHDEAGKLVATFRVTDERDFADAAEGPITLEGLATVGIVHPLHLAPAEASAWGEVFADYEIIPPFPQLGRPVHRLEPGEEAATDLMGRVEGEIPAVTLVGILERLGWDRGIPQDAGLFHEHSRPFEGSGVTAVIQYPGIPVGSMIDWDAQTVHSCSFVPGIYTPAMYPDHAKALPLGRVDPVAISEVIATLETLAAKAT